ncbi:tRNA (guanosine(37)-N1)-methyltransferase TrmD [Candidatus Wolfebacteria bacterium CG10_big_fil_rev_8_21_14_0_10_31_9]|uniref:tRNA (guanine-N(1)-)-methyltransferase n=1 Tax=Candidatus Wolfebacteria bacterium CG10_big_fil_rev_8_21_14_0_10_31_9 TaxID=1975070 RepID=A0A2H0RCR8_9BACT|nr:MAG: tRNA (guanosine(37)-N1)-methyltransferase TrmD [Candidatus Wolfebacteria bacterium CG10_big_fil_rev_8_21_14_0_10_31_9]
MKFDIITIFPNIFSSYLNESILKRAQKNKLLNIKIHNLRDFAKDKHKKVDDRPFGGGPGMVFKIEPIIKAISDIKSKVLKKKTIIILFNADGKQFDEKMAQKLVKEEQLVMICGRYEGVDGRVKKAIKDLGFKVQEISIGPYVLTGGELPAMVLIDSISRKISGVLGKTESLEEKRLGVGVPTYTRPDVFIYKGKKYQVPKVLLSGNHAEIEKWKKSRLRNTK